ncbi:hypothetical protein CHELA1G11_10040 [Hyphomicrobiales bacterium]|nr:hypothetical protein CHELA1G11_10040 [Hyphomicrobiales bacterium]CAH1677490.1 hypothetical protein CHELA1G2_14269 [Hyphomicrobiales bacterium]
MGADRRRTALTAEMAAPWMSRQDNLEAMPERGGRSCIVPACNGKRVPHKTDSETFLTFPARQAHCEWPIKA